MHRKSRALLTATIVWWHSLAFAAPAAFDLTQLTQLLATKRSGEATFVEQREVSVLDRTVTTSGRLSFEAPDTFVRENLKLRLLSARLALLSRNQTTLKSDLQASQAALTRYFDNTSKKTQTVVDLVKQVDAGSAAVELPNLNTSLQAVNQYRSRG